MPRPCTRRSMPSPESSALPRLRPPCSFGAGTETRRAHARFWTAKLPRHDPFLLGDMAAACDAIRAAIAAGKRICVHGDYDADGVCATALAVLVLRELGADVTWHLPSRFDEGYGIHADTLTRLAEEGCGLVLTVDCGVTAVDEVVACARARAGCRRHRSPPGRGGAARLPGRRALSRRLPVPRALRHGRRVEARRGAARARVGGSGAAPRPRRGGDRRRRRAAGRREPGACRRRGCACSRGRRSRDCAS